MVRVSGERVHCRTSFTSGPSLDLMQVAKARAHADLLEHTEVTLVARNSHNTSPSLCNAARDDVQANWLEVM
eukprot:4394444-Amphidinium_carterae.1